MVTFVSFLVFAVENRPKTDAEPGDDETNIDNLFNGVYWGVVCYLIFT